MSVDEYVTDRDRWGYLAGARFVGPHEWAEVAEKHLYPSMHLWGLAEGLIEAADEEGRLIDFRPNEFYEGALSDSMRNEDDPADWKLTYDRFSAAVVMGGTVELAHRGFLAQRGNGDTADYRLSLPPVGEPA
ncbi:hypothetical protein [Micromonospora sp. LH3U1]|uniref:hypothetical protein n=1 Tax=Micromonospora sp. LH3U1 TaxID=3018339 RepID=UPI00234A9FAA|nr:hypothetical protein [Micromonospora sp. LH3U1]WCN83868.1 hypothetical protein PCA76_12885 [Micromonospora sp. LH3U1]